MKSHIAFGLLLLSPAFLFSAPRKFDFGRSSGETDRTLAQASDLYSATTGYGFEPSAPSLFSVQLPEGNYLVKLRLGSAERSGETTIKAESRRLMALAVKTGKGEFQTLTLAVNVRTPKLVAPPKNAPGGIQVDLNDREQGVAHWDDKLTLEFNGEAAAVAALEIEACPDVPTLYLAGDSTVTDQTGEPAAEWGQMLTAFLLPDIAVANHAESGETLKSFISGHRLDKVLEGMKQGDFLMIQFGHNDSKKQWPQTYVDAFGTYQAYLRVLIAEARRRGAQPILVTSMHRRRFTADGKVQDTHGDYPAAVRALAKDMGLPLIDLHGMSASFYEALGPERSAAAFTDATHHNVYGAYELARCMVEAIKSSVPQLAKHLKPGLPSFDPAHPDAPESIRIPASPYRMTKPPRGN